MVGNSASLALLQLRSTLLPHSIATGYGLDGLGIESRWRRDFPHMSIPILGPTQPPAQWVPGLSRGKERLGRAADPSSLLVLWSRKSRAIPVLPLWAVRPVQSLSACTRVHFTPPPLTSFRLFHYTLLIAIYYAHIVCNFKLSPRNT